MHGKDYMSFTVKRLVMKNSHMYFTIRNWIYMFLRRRGFAMPRRDVQRAEHPYSNAVVGVPYECRLTLRSRS